MPVVAGQGSVHLKQVMLRPQEAVQILRMEAHHQADVIEPAKRKGVLEYRLRSGVHFADLKDLGQKKSLITRTVFRIQFNCQMEKTLVSRMIGGTNRPYLFLRDESAWSVSQWPGDSHSHVLRKETIKMF